MLVVDDVHWADAPSLRWLALLARPLAELRARACCARFAPASRRRDPSCSPSCSRPRPEPPVRPRPLGPAAASRWCASGCRRRAPAFAHACHAATAGNPFLLGALLDQLVAERLGPTDEVAARLERFGPEQVARTVERQLARLPDGAAALARAFAVLGRARRCGTPATLAELEPRRAPRGWPTGCGPPACSTDDRERYALVHPLVAGALYASLPAGERALLHARAAALLARERADPEAVALHLLHTEPAGDAATVTRPARRGEPRQRPRSA